MLNTIDSIKIVFLIIDVYNNIDRFRTKIGNKIWAKSKVPNTSIVLYLSINVIFYNHQTC